jgi:hypothetical protein
MTRNDSRARGRVRLRTMAGIGLLVAYAGCGFDGVEVPELIGPSEQGTSVTLTASPDVMVADGFSTSLITATVRDQNGQPAAGRDIFFAISDASGNFADIGSLRSLATGVDVGTGQLVRTNAQGIAAVVYEAPARTDATANQIVRVTARPVGTDADARLYRTVAIELRSAESRLFPEVAGNTPPTCGFAVQVTGKSNCGPTSCTIPINTSVLFQSTAHDEDPGGFIIRYFWNFGNGRTADHADVSTSYSLAGTYIVTHIVTDNNGGQAGCQTTIIAQ